MVPDNVSLDLAADLVVWEVEEGLEGHLADHMDSAGEAETAESECRRFLGPNRRYGQMELVQELEEQ